MQDVLSRLIGKRVDLYCGSASNLRGEVLRVEGNVLHLKDNDEKVCFIAIEKIVAVWEATDPDHQAGFVSKL
ncbi:MAG TPA: MM0924 family protein [Pyrinomonadaceae bacterium]|nr:MM0924 family protein [Pyrinomonadaceae bacterium]